MSHHARIVPWRTPSELRAVKALFFSSPSTPDQQLQALRTVRSWTVRGRIPHSVEATAMLVEAVLNDTPSSSQLNARMAYSTAICRFVNGLLDPVQQSQFALPMHALAKQLNLPASFVEIRHAATHESFPSLVVFRAVAHRALDWLWENYWSGIGEDEGGSGGARAVGLGDGWLARARGAVRQWRKLRKGNPAAGIKTGDGNPAWGVIRECVGICKISDGMDALVDALLEEKALIPAGKRKSPLMGGAFMLWSPLLGALDSSSTSFATNLMFAMLNVFKSSHSSPIAQLVTSSVLPLSLYLQQHAPPSFDPELCEAVLAWLQYLTSADAEAKFGRNATWMVGLEEVVKQCVLAPNEWSVRLLHHLLKEHSALKGRYSTIVDMAVAQVELVQPKDEEAASKKRKLLRIDDTGSPAKKRSIRSVEEELEVFETQFEVIQKIRRGRNIASSRDAYSIPEGGKEGGVEGQGQGSGLGGEVVGGWREWSGEWTPRPIGVL